MHCVFLPSILLLFENQTFVARIVLLYIRKSAITKAACAMLRFVYSLIVSERVSETEAAIYIYIYKNIYF